MEAFFDNKNNVVNARIRSSVDESVLYTLKTTFNFRGRHVTILQDANPGPGGVVTVGAIHWQDRIIEVLGHKKKFSDVKRHAGKPFRKCRYWKWDEGRTEYSLKYNYEDWKVRVLDAILPNDEVAGTFAVPFRPHLFSKATPTTLELTREGLAKDEVFLILIFVYSEAKRQDQTVGSSSSLTLLS
ncbi:uncharacterized protein BT62DRAFT_967583 [Guyanagaster necrorhizus]|uniref:Uncharacterized protein n=1 Tax=Guyanagaster necrorhizus TaxID=856835 RepID=A0A9P8ASY2_9AGAR|nr:uncharacterized protein BT62DRAFT_967583 [Guyanagaster necrorhizus MCA 3950]KAG7446824.1 hypothetical protein BT62DRAFT_967583 [Guyanagaster necrorhizus MCA 3950]